MLTQYNMRPIHRERSSILGKAESLHFRERELRRKPPRGSHSNPGQRSKRQTAQDHGKDNALPATTMLYPRSTHDRHWQQRKFVWAYPTTTHRHMSNRTLMHHNVLGHTRPNLAKCPQRDIAPPTQRIRSLSQRLLQNRPRPWQRQCFAGNDNALP